MEKYMIGTAMMVESTYREDNFLKHPSTWHGLYTDLFFYIIQQKRVVLILQYGTIYVEDLESNW